MRAFLSAVHSRVRTCTEGVIRNKEATHSEAYDDEDLEEPKSEITKNDTELPPHGTAWIILSMRLANGRRCYIVTSSLIGWAHTQNDPCTVYYNLLYTQGCQPLKYYFRILLKKFPYFEKLFRIP